MKQIYTVVFADVNKCSIFERESEERLPIRDVVDLACVLTGIDVADIRPLDENRGKITLRNKNAFDSIATSEYVIFWQENTQLHIPSFGIDRQVFNDYKLGSNINDTAEQPALASCD